ncbi:MAG: DUF3810 domain-containing protein [Firmicutes bacterium]|nr:DUF3810 domain-containing protein [Bacillota bacterium]
MKKDYFAKKYYLMLLLPAGVLLSYWAERSPYWVETIYSRRVFFAMNQILSRCTGHLPFSLAEMVVLLLGIIAVRVIGIFIVKMVTDKENRLKRVANFLANTLIVISLIYFAFNLVWGFNYYRLPFATIAGLEVEPTSVVELEGLCKSLIDKANRQRTTTAENNEGVMRLRDGRAHVFTSAGEGFSMAASIYPQLGGTYGQAKGVRISEVMSYANITGIYFPFTGEANVNTTIPDYMLPSTTCHELAHQRGFAREDEANYIAYLTCILHPHPDFQYSGTLLAVIYATNALYRHDPERAQLLTTEYGAGLQRDLAHRRLFWQRYEGPLENISREINDSYLKANRQEDGVHSYGRMVDLLLAAYRKQNDGK